MTSLTVIENKISSVRKYLKILDRYRQYSQKDIEGDVDRKGAVERYLYLAVQAAIDLAEAVISYKNLRKPTTLSESFHILNEEGVIPAKLMEEMVRMTGFRNVMANDYEKIDYAIVCDVLKNRLSDIEEFINKISGIK